MKGGPCTIAAGLDVGVEREAAVVWLPHEMGWALLVEVSEMTFALDLHGGWLAVLLRALQDHMLPVFPPWSPVALGACLGATAGPHNDRSIQRGREGRGTTECLRLLASV